MADRKGKSGKVAGKKVPAPAAAIKAVAKKEGENGGACSICKNDGVIFQSYANMHLCRKHFLSQVDEKFRKAVREFRMIKAGEHVGVALSGGKDSTVMLHLLHALSKKHPMKLTAILVDEGIAGYRSHSVQTARRECAKLGVKLIITSFAKEFGKPLDGMLKMRKMGAGRQGACTFCGVFRRTLLNRAALRAGVSKLAVGHNLDDAAQTLMMNMMRNEPARLARFGIAGGVVGNEGFIPRIKPLIRIPEREIALYALLCGIEIHYMQCPYAEEALRQDVRRSLNSLEEKYPGTKQRMLNSFLAMRPALMAWAKTEAERGKPMEVCAKCGDAASSDTCSSCRLLAVLGVK